MATLHPVLGLLCGLAMVQAGEGALGHAPRRAASPQRCAQAGSTRAPTPAALHLRPEGLGPFRARRSPWPLGLPRSAQKLRYCGGRSRHARGARWLWPAVQEIQALGFAIRGWETLCDCNQARRDANSFGAFFRGHEKTGMPFPAVAGAAIRLGPFGTGPALPCRSTFQATTCPCALGRLQHSQSDPGPLQGARRAALCFAGLACWGARLFRRASLFR